MAPAVLLLHCLATPKCPAPRLFRMLCLVRVATESRARLPQASLASTKGCAPSAHSTTLYNDATQYNQTDRVGPGAEEEQRTAESSSRGAGGGRTPCTLSRSGKKSGDTRGTHFSIQ